MMKTIGDTIYEREIRALWKGRLGRQEIKKIDRWERVEQEI